MKKTNTLEKLLKETNYTQEEWKTYKKLEKHFALEDLKNTLDDKLADNYITEEDYKLACKNADKVIDDYLEWVDTDWQETMNESIRYTIDMLKRREK